MTALIAVFSALVFAVLFLATPVSWRAARFVCLLGALAFVVFAAWGLRQPITVSVVLR